MGREEARRIEEALTNRHGHLLRQDERFAVEGRLQGSLASVKVTLSNSDESYFYPVEASADLTEVSQPNPKALQELLLDFVDYYYGRYLAEERDLYLPIDWAPVVFGEDTVMARGQVLNLKAERLADELLKRSGEE